MRQMNRRETIKLFAFAAPAILVGCGPAATTYRFRMTIEIATAQGLETGSSVMEVRASRGMAIGDTSGVSAVLHGQAVVVDLPDGPVFALLKLPDAGPSLASVINAALFGKPIDTPDAVIASTAKLGSTWLGSYKAELPHRRDIGPIMRADKRDDSNWPLFVRFRNLEDPESIEVVDPETVGVKRITLKTTNDSISTGIVSRLPWLECSPRFFEPVRDSRGMLTIPSRPLTQAQLVKVYDFSTELGRDKSACHHP